MEEEKQKLKLAETEKELVDSFLKNPENKKNAVLLAFQISKEFSTWFSIKKLLNRFKIDKQEATVKLNVLKMFNLIVSKEEKGVSYYKIDMDHKIQRDLLNKEITFHEGQVLFFKEKLANLD